MAEITFFVLMWSLASPSLFLFLSPLTNMFTSDIPPGGSGSQLGVKYTGRLLEDQIGCGKHRKENKQVATSIAFSLDDLSQLIDSGQTTLKSFQRTIVSDICWCESLIDLEWVEKKFNLQIDALFKATT